VFKLPLKHFSFKIQSNIDRIPQIVPIITMLQIAPVVWENVPLNNQNPKSFQKMSERNHIEMA
jgi:hypothetical protein